jgi:hypothetical protein
MIRKYIAVKLNIVHETKTEMEWWGYIAERMRHLKGCGIKYQSQKTLVLLLYQPSKKGKNAPHINQTYT